MTKERYLRLSDIEKMTRKAPGRLLAILPEPSLIIGGNEAVSLWSCAEVDAALQELAKQDIADLERQKAALLDDLVGLEKTARDLKAEIKRVKEEIRFFPHGRGAIDASMKQGTDALWSWEPPMPPPERIQGVYRLMRDGKTMYIGQSVDVMNRISAHATQKDFDQFSYARVDGDRNTLNEIESALIIVERPPWNHGLDGTLKHPTGQSWTREQALAVLDKYRAAISDAERDAA